MYVYILIDVAACCWLDIHNTGAPWSL